MDCQVEYPRSIKQSAIYFTQLQYQVLSETYIGQWVLPEIRDKMRGKMRTILLEYPFTRVGLQLMFCKVCSKIHLLACRGQVQQPLLKAVILKKARSKKVIQHTHTFVTEQNYLTLENSAQKTFRFSPVRNSALRFCLMKFSVKCNLCRRGFLASESKIYL